MEEWLEIDDFPRYSVSNYGRVINVHTDRILRQNITQRGIPTVTLHYAHQRYCRAVPVLVANAWLPPPPWDHFDTPTHLDGDRLNCHIDNLVWRPRWFARKYHRRILVHEFPNWDSGPLELIQTGEIFETPRDAALQLGLIEMEIFLSLLNETEVYPGYFKFRILR